MIISMRVEDRAVEQMHEAKPVVSVCCQHRDTVADAYKFSMDSNTCAGRPVDDGSAGAVPVLESEGDGMKGNLIGAGLVVLFATALPAAAAHDHQSMRGSVIGERQHELLRMIDRGIRSGDISRREARQLHAEQQAIRDKERYYRADGVITRAERRDLMRDLSISEQRIYNAMSYTNRHHARRPF
jgi:hypothetical protein